MSGRLIDAFTSHPRSVDETYLEHMVMAAGFGTSMIVAGLACLVHAAFPFLFAHTGSGAIARLHERMVTHRRRAPAPGAVPRPQPAE